MVARPATGIQQLQEPSELLDVLGGRARDPGFPRGGDGGLVNHGCYLMDQSMGEEAGGSTTV